MAEVDISAINIKNNMAMTDLKWAIGILSIHMKSQGRVETSPHYFLRVPQKPENHRAPCAETKQEK